MNEYDQKILAVLDTMGGFTTAQVAVKMQQQFGGNKRQHSSAVRSWMVDLERRGLVRKLDDQKPDCWVKTSEGEEALTAACN
jgi:hypothetical protein